MNKEFYIKITLEHYHTKFGRRVEREMMVIGGDVDINNVVEDMIDTLEKIK